MYPYSSISCGADFNKKILRMINGGKDDASVGRSASLKCNRLWPEYLRFCPMCVCEDENVYGEAYWHRVHQVPGVVYCTKHKIRLMNSNVSRKRASTSFCVASGENLPVIETTRSSDEFEKFKDKFLKIAKESEWLLNYGMGLSWESGIAGKYKNLFQEKGVASVSYKMIHYDWLLEGLNNYWDEDFLNLLYSETGDPDQWMFGFHYQRLRHFKPLYHILLMCFLKETVKEFLDCQISDNLFGEKPWPCKNPICNNPMVENTNIRYLNGRAIAFFHCENCGMRYKILKTISRTTEAIIEDYGFLWQDKLKYLLGVEKLTIPDAAKVLQCSHHIIPWQKKKLGINTNEYVCSPHKYDAETGARAYHESIVLNLLSQNKVVTPQYMKNNFPGTYSYFFYHDDLAWLRAHTVYAKDLECHKEDDRNMLKKAQDAVEYIKSNREKLHITRANIAKFAGVKEPTLKAAQIRPLTKAYVDSVIESRENWLRRRIYMLFEERKLKGLPTKTLSIVIRHLSLKPNTYVTYQKFIEEVLDEMNRPRDQTE